MEEVVICQEMGWTLEEYSRQPTWFLDRIKDKLLVESEIGERDSKKIREKNARL